MLDIFLKPGREKACTFWERKERYYAYIFLPCHIQWALHFVPGPQMKFCGTLLTRSPSCTFQPRGNICLLRPEGPWSVAQPRELWKIRCPCLHWSFYQNSLGCWRNLCISKVHISLYTKPMGLLMVTRVCTLFGI